MDAVNCNQPTSLVLGFVNCTQPTQSTLLVLGFVNSTQPTQLVLGFVWRRSMERLYPTQFYATATGELSQRPNGLAITPNSCTNSLKRAGVKDCAPSDQAFAGLG